MAVRVVVALLVMRSCGNGGRGRGGQLRVHSPDANNRTYLHSLPCQPVFTSWQQVNQLQISPDKQSIAAAGNPQIRLYDLASSSNEPVRVVRALPHG